MVGSLHPRILFVGVGVIGGCSGHTTPTVPTLLSPYQGQATGTVFSTAGALNPLRPTFRWTAVDGSAGYDIQIDGSCSGPKDCAFTAPVVDQRTSGTSFIPSADLNVSTSAPVGARYFWRVSACDSSGACAAWSRVGIVDVGRQRQDFNGDGYADLAVVVRLNGSALFVYLGAPTLPTSPSWILRPDTSAGGGTEMGFDQVLWLGDVNADGFADLAVIVNHQDAPDTLRLYLGGASPATTPVQDVSNTPFSNPSIISLLSGDMNGDGFADVFQNYQGLSSISDVVSYGPDLGSDDVASSPLGTGIVAACDFDSDGYTDLVEDDLLLFRGSQTGPLGGTPARISVPSGQIPVGCAWNLNGLGSASLVLRAGAGHTPSLMVASSWVAPSAAACDGPLPALSAGAGSAARGGPVADVGDADGDGYDDLLVGDPANNRAALYFGGCPVQRVVELPGGTEFGGGPSAGGAVAATGDLDGDGHPDFAVANVFGNFDSYCAGEVYIYRGGPSSASQTTPSIILTDPDHTATPGGCTGDDFGRSLD
jgi:FG-GAP-like repeat